VKTGKNLSLRKSADATRQASAPAADNVPVTGRVVVISRSGGIASNYDCTTCNCPITLYDVNVAPGTCTMVVGGIMQCTATATYHNCNGYPYYYDETNWSTWSTDNASVSTVNSTGLETIQGGGTSTIKARFSDATSYTYRCYHGCTCIDHINYRDGSHGTTGQVPTSLSIVSGTDSTTSESSCTTSGGLAGCGVTRTFKYQVNDQNGQPIRMANMAFGDVICITPTNQLNFGSFQTTCGGTTGSCSGTAGPCGQSTDANGQFTERLAVCAPACKPSGTCITAGQTVANQTWTVAGHTLSSDVKSLSYQCNKILVNGQ
jgi:hypothetical protein